MRLGGQRGICYDWEVVAGAVPSAGGSGATGIGRASERVVQAAAHKGILANDLTEGRYS
jgi:hypothetical protein